MLLARSNMISQIDSYCECELGISVESLMGRAGKRVADVVRENVKLGSTVLVFAGKGNNGGDGYACAAELLTDYEVTVYDVFGAGQNRAEGKLYLEKFKQAGGRVENLTLTDEVKSAILSADCIIDAVFGTGFSGTLPSTVSELCHVICSSVKSFKIAIDVPIGVNADDGSVAVDGACAMAVTVALCFIKPGLMSFPARAFVGRIVYDDLGIPIDKVVEKFKFKYSLIDNDCARSLLPVRDANSHKGSFGRVLAVVGSARFRGAAHLALAAALRGGAGLVDFYGTEELCSELSAKYPEAIYTPSVGKEEILMEDVPRILELSKRATAVLVGSGCGQSVALGKLVSELLRTEGAPLILDADAINSLASLGEEGIGLLKESKRTVVLTPHPLEFSRLSANSVSDVQLHRIEAALKFAGECRVVLLLKGAASVITDGELLYINSTGSSALSKGGSGDVLAGLVASMIASGATALNGAALSAYYHGLAADKLAAELSEYGVTPSDLPIEIAKQIAGSTK